MSNSIVEMACKWLVKKYGQGEVTFCHCPGCGLELCQSDCWHSKNGDDVIRYQCIQCGHKSGWLFDVPAPILVEGMKKTK